MKKIRRVVLAVVVLGLGVAISQEEVSVQLQDFDLPIISPEKVPLSGTFYFAYETQASKHGYPPIPYNPLLELGLKIYSLGPGVYLVDNRTCSLAQFAQAQAAENAVRGIQHGFRRTTRASWRGR